MWRCLPIPHPKSGWRSSRINLLYKKSMKATIQAIKKCSFLKLCTCTGIIHVKLKVSGVLKLFLILLSCSLWLLKYLSSPFILRRNAPSFPTLNHTLTHLQKHTVNRRNCITCILGVYCIRSCAVKGLYDDVIVLTMILSECHAENKVKILNLAPVDLLP